MIFSLSLTLYYVYRKKQIVVEAEIYWKSFDFPSSGVNFDCNLLYHKINQEN